MKVWSHQVLILLLALTLGADASDQVEAPASHDGGDSARAHVSGAAGGLGGTSARGPRSDLAQWRSTASGRAGQTPHEVNGLVGGSLILISTDEAAPESDPDHNSNADADLTSMYASFKGTGPDSLIITVDFSSPWIGMHLMVALERNGDADGGTQDPFEFPISYAHPLKPDYVFTYKYSADDYADLRRWNGAWEFWYLDDEMWSADIIEGKNKNARSMVSRTESQVIFAFPASAIGAILPGDTLRLQSYVSLEAWSEPDQAMVKANALDSNPHDLTHDMEPDEGEWWETATNPVTLSQYASYVIPAYGTPPLLSSAIASPDSADPLDDVRFSVRVEDAGGGIGDVSVDLSGIGGDAAKPLLDDGTGGDETAADGIYSALYTVPRVVGGGTHIIDFSARDSTNVMESITSTSLTIITAPELVVSVADSVGDDHGPNATDASGDPVPGLYYLYPTNRVFFAGAFDMHEVALTVDGQYLVVRIHVGNLPASDDVGWDAWYPEDTCTDPDKADLNLHKVDIYIDSEEGVGATVGLPYRYVDIAEHDAWEYAVAIEGWWKGFVESNGDNRWQFWTIRKQTAHIDFCDNHVEDYIDVKIGLTALGNPTPDEIRRWDFIVTMASHDGESNDLNLGAIRWVHANVSEWQFGGGRNAEGGRDRDANLIDVVTIPGLGKAPGRTQEEMLNYLTDEAWERFDSGLHSCVLEASFPSEGKGVIIGRVEVEGPPADVDVYVVNTLTGEVGGDGVKTVHGGTGTFQILSIEDGTYSLIAKARGYAAYDSLVTITGEDLIEVDIALSLARATRYSFVDSLGNEICSELVTVSMIVRDSLGVAVDSIFTYEDLLFEPRDDHGNPATLSGVVPDSVTVRVTLIDPSILPSGNVVLAADGQGVHLIDSLVTAEMFEDDIGRFWVRNDSLEVLRIEVSKDSLAGVVELRVKELEPKKVRLTPDTTEIVVGGAERIELAVQLMDDVDNPIPVRDVRVGLVAVEGDPIIEPRVGTSDGNGFFKTSVFGYRAGLVKITARSEDDLYTNLESDTAEVVFRPGPPAAVFSELDPIAVDKSEEGLVAFQVVDRFGNAVARDSVSIALSRYPEGRLDSLETPVSTDTTGLATAYFRAGSRYGFVTIEGMSEYRVEPVTLSIAPAALVAQDETAPESDPDHNSHPDLDLTTMYAAVVADTLMVGLDFSNAWGGVHLIVALEKNGDEAGGSQDPFQFPISYDHTLKPDFVFTYKYSDESYADLRRWNNGWEYWHLANETWITDAGDQGKDAKSMVVKTPSEVWFGFPLTAIGEVSAGDTLRLEAYVSQEVWRASEQRFVKYNALDSSPQDATHDMDPDEGNWWDNAEDLVTLSEYGVYVVPLLTIPPSLTYATASPDSTFPGEEVTFSVTVEDSGEGIGDVFVDLSPLAGDAVTWLYDDGTHGDSTARDGSYANEFTIPSGVAQGIHDVIFVGRDSLNLAASTALVPVKITTLPEPFISVRDSVGDDHGPNIKDASGNPEPGLYYYYPTNGVFAPGAFDIESVEFMIDGSWLAIKIKVGEVPSSDAVGWNATYPGEKCTDPNKADLNLQKIDIYIDSEEGVGATAGLPNRNHDIARNDAWEYAVAIEGWWRGFVTSNGENATAFWNITKLASNMYFCTDHVNDIIEVKIALEALGLLQAGEDMTEEKRDAVEREIKTWEFIITMASHDGESNDENLGAIRWVNRGTSEWQFGGGRDGEGGRDRDPNIIDVVTVRDSLSFPGRTQEEMLNYDLPQAQKRFVKLLHACVLEATFSEDISPPDIDPFHRGRFGHSRWWVLEHSPASFWTLIKDESGVEDVEFRWRPEGQRAWNVTEMGNIVEGYWVADIDPQVLEGTTRAVKLVDGSMGRPFQAEIYARDEFGNQGRSEFLTFAVADEKLASDDSTGIKPGDVFIAYDGTFVLMPDTTLSDKYDEFDVRVTPLPEVGTPSVDLSNLRSSMHYLGVGRQVDVIGYSLEDTSMISKLDNSMIVALHYPSYVQSHRLDEQQIGLFRFNDVTERWIGIYGSVNDWGNAVRAEVSEVGTFGLFADSRLSYDSGKGLSGVIVEPNPFSPNGDGFYDETRINFFLSREIDWITIEIYDISGEAVRTIRWQEGLTRLTRNEVHIDWDGKDDSGKVVPYGIYILRVEARFKVAPYLERENIAVVVIK